MTAEEYLKDRVDDQISWYGKKSVINKTSYLWTNGLIIVFAALIPFCAGFLDQVPWLNYAIATLGVLTAVATGLSSLLKFQEKWTTYRLTAESLRREKLLFITATGPYVSGIDSFKLFVANAENLMGQEHAGWIQIINKKDGQTGEDY